MSLMTKTPKNRRIVTGLYGGLQYYPVTLSSERVPLPYGEGRGGIRARLTPVPCSCPFDPESGRPVPSGPRVPPSCRRGTRRYVFDLCLRGVVVGVLFSNSRLVAPRDGVKQSSVSSFVPLEVRTGPVSFHPTHHSKTFQKWR